MKIEFEGKVVGRFYESDYYCDVLDEKEKDVLTDKLIDLEDKRVRVLVDVIGEEEE